MANTAEDLDLGRYQLGWSDVEDYYVFKPKKGLNEDIVREMSWMKGEPQVDDGPSPEGAPLLRAPADADLGRGHVRDRFRQHFLLHKADRQAGKRLGPAPRLGQGHLRQARDPRSGA